MNKATTSAARRSSIDESIDAVISREMGRFETHAEDVGPIPVNLEEFQDEDTEVFPDPTDEISNAMRNSQFFSVDDDEASEDAAKSSSRESPWVEEREILRNDIMAHWTFLENYSELGVHSYFCPLAVCIAYSN